MFAPDLIRLAENVRDTLSARGLWVATAESCTGGLIAGCLTAVAGSSAVVDRGFVTYTNDAKVQMLGVPADLIARLGAVSGPVAAAMAQGALAHSRADIAVSVTGIAGPGGGTDAKPVGLVHLGVAHRGGGVRVEHHVFPGDREAVRLATVSRALELVLEAGRA
ncbi:CinA family protein [Niveispirillum fermenti]|uniref:CinA family protein n=1 Tax=Niveispirillum fermenti TaxID=1233113 RepID=UPI003A89A67C